MAPPRKALQKFVQLYTAGPEFIRGDWAKCSVAAGLKTPPDRDEPLVCRLIDEARAKMKPPPEPEPEPEPIAEPEPQPEPEPEPEPAEPVAPVDDPLAGLEIATEAGIPWTELKSRLTRVIEGVAKGEVKATAAQVSMIKEILAQSKEEAAASQRGARGVILLPVQGAGEGARLDEQMRQQIRANEQTRSD